MKLLDLFCGAGGFSEGFRSAGFNVIGGADNDPDACATYALNFPEAEVVWGNLRNLEIRDRVAELAADADVIVGGPPCQAFSQVRNHDRLLNDPRNSLYLEFRRVIERALPDAFIMENVPGLSQLRVKERILEHLSLEGEYEVSYGEHDAADFGVPQTRKRILFVAVKASLGVSPPALVPSGAVQALGLVRKDSRRGVRYHVQSRDLFAGHLLHQLHDGSDLRVVSAAQALSDFCFLGAGSRQDKWSVHELPAPVSAYQMAMRGEVEEVSNLRTPRINRDTVLRLRAIPPGGNYLDLPDELRGRYLTGDRWGPHNGSGRLGRRHYYAYRRLHPDFVAWTLNTKADSVYHWQGERALSVREFARLQSFPDSFIFSTDLRKEPLEGRIEGGAAHSRYRQVGNAVPPLLAKACAAALFESLGATEQRQRMTA